VECGEPQSAPGLLRSPKIHNQHDSVVKVRPVAGDKNPGPPRRWLLVLVTKGDDLSGACCPDGPIVGSASGETRRDFQNEIVPQAAEGVKCSLARVTRYRAFRLATCGSIPRIVVVVKRGGRAALIPQPLFPWREEKGSTSLAIRQFSRCGRRGGAHRSQS
jgi:hypothetical protein